MVEDRSLDVRVALAGNPQAGPVLEPLAEDKHTEVVEKVLHNPATPTEVLVALAGHRNRGIRKAAGDRLVALNARPGGTSAPELRDHAFAPVASDASSTWPPR